MSIKKNMKDYNRRELLELILELSEENEALKERITTLEKQDKDRVIVVKEKDSVAQITKIFKGVFEIVREVNSNRKYSKNIKKQ